MSEGADGRSPLPRRAAGKDSAPYEPLMLPFRRRALRPWLEQWKALVPPDACPFFQPAFFVATARHLAEGEPLFAGVTRAGKLVGALPLMRKGRSLVTLASLHTPRFDYVGDPAALGALWKGLARFKRWDVLDLARIPVGSPLVLELPGIVRAARGHVDVAPHTRSPRYALQGFEDRLPTKFKNELRRRAKKAGGVHFERVTRFDRDALRDAFAIEAASWKGVSLTAIACDARLVRFYTAIARYAAQKKALSLGFLVIDGRRAAMHFAVEAGGTYYLLKPGYDPEYAAFGPGQLLQRAASIDAYARGLGVCDLLGKDDAWKLVWTSEATKHVMMRCYRATPLGLARYALSRARPHVGAARRKLASVLRGGD